MLGFGVQGVGFRAESLGCSGLEFSDRMSKMLYPWFGTRVFFRDSRGHVRSMLSELFSGDGLRPQTLNPLNPEP